MKSCFESMGLLGFTSTDISLQPTARHSSRAKRRKALALETVCVLLAVQLAFLNLSPTACARILDSGLDVEPGEGYDTKSHVGDYEAVLPVRQTGKLSGTAEGKRHGQLAGITGRAMIARSLLQSSGSCHFITNSGTSLRTITSAQCATTQFGATERYAACCVSLCVTSGSPALCTCTGYSDASVTCGDSQPLAGCCAEPGGGSQAGTATHPSETPLPTTPIVPPPTIETPTRAPNTIAPANPIPNPVPAGVPPSAAPFNPATNPVSSAPQTPVPTGVTLPPIVPVTSPPISVATSSPRPVASSPPAQVVANTAAPTSTVPDGPSKSDSGGTATKIGVAVAAPLFAVAATGVTWAAFAFRFRRRKRAIIERTIEMATECYPSPALPNPKQYRLGLVQENLRVILTRVLSTWDAWNGCAQKKTFPSRGEVGIWKIAFHGKESALLLGALQHVDATFGRRDGFEGLLDRWQQEPASHSYTLAKLCEFVDDAKAHDVV